MINDLFNGIGLLYLAICAVFILVEVVCSADEVTLGCPDPELHDRNNENFEVLTTALSEGN